MPQDRLRSVVYRSFVTCDDPKGVVECKPIRKSKTGSQRVEDRIKNEGSRKNLNLSSSDHEKRKEKVSVSKGSTEELQNLSSFQIMEVSRGAEKLNEVVDLWSTSNGISFDKKSKKIAQDLLKGALDLQESIAMLGKLQEASRYMAKLNRKQKEKVVEEKEVARGAEFTNSIRIGDCNRPMDFQKPRTSADGSTRDCYEELREVIRESLSRQNLLPKSSSTRERDYFEGRKSDFYMDFPSTSSSQSSQIFSHDFASSDSSPLKVQHEKPKQSNLIAKLMGLEEVPSEPLHSISQKHVEKNEFLNQRRYLFDSDLPRARKPRFAAQKVVQDRRTLEEMIESMQFKGLLESKSIHGERRSNVSYSRKGFRDTGSPIVIMRPLHIPELHKNYYVHEEKAFDVHEEEAFEGNQMPRKWKEEFPLNAAEHPKGPLKPTELHRRMPPGRPSRQKPVNGKETKNCGEVSAKLDDKSKDVQENLSCTRIKIPKPDSSKLQRKDSAVTKIDKVLKVSPNSDTQQPAEIRTLISRGSSKTRVLGHTTTSKLGKPEKNRGARERATISDKFTRRTASVSSNSQKKNSKNDKADSKPSLAIVETIMPIDFAGKTEINETVMPSEQVPEEIAIASGNSVFDKCSNTSGPLEFSTPIIEDIRSADKGNLVPNNNLPENESRKTETNTRSLLLNNASFLRRVDELFDTQTRGPTSCPTTLLRGYELLDTELLLDCANEMLERKSLQLMITTYPPSQTRSRCCSSLDHLVQEICDGIEDFRSYSKLSREIIVVVDVIYSMLERDLWCTRDLIGAWDVGWRTGYTSEGVEEVVADIERLVLSEIVEDALADFAY